MLRNLWIIIINFDLPIIKNNLSHPVKMYNLKFDFHSQL